eukprot:6103453-Pleurochrysis_carterae.AAC.4
MISADVRVESSLDFASGEVRGTALKHSKKGTLWSWGGAWAWVQRTYSPATHPHIHLCMRR